MLIINQGTGETMFIADYLIAVGNEHLECAL